MSWLKKAVSTTANATSAVVSTTASAVSNTGNIVTSATHNPGKVDTSVDWSDRVNPIPQLCNIARGGLKFRFASDEGKVLIYAQWNPYNRNHQISFLKFNEGTVIKRVQCIDYRYVPYKEHVIKHRTYKEIIEFVKKYISNNEANFIISKRREFAIRLAEFCGVSISEIDGKYTLMYTVNDTIKGVSTGINKVIVDKKYLWGANDYNQCLKQLKELAPQLYQIPDIWRDKRVSITPGYPFELLNIHPSKWSVDNVGEWISWVDGRKYGRYRKRFIENECAGEDLECLDKNILRDEYKVNKLTHRRDIMKAIQNLLQATNPSDEDENEEKYVHTQNPSGYSSNEQIKLVDNPLIIFFGIACYEATNYPDLYDIAEDEAFFRNTFEKDFHYKFVSNSDFSREWTKKDALDWILAQRDDILIKNKCIQHNGLVFCGASHGSTHAIICSDGEPLLIQDIRSLFSWSVNIQLKNIPKLFVFNSCRTEYEKARNAQSNNSTEYLLSITGKEGNPVFGSKLSRYVATAFAACYQRNKQAKVYDILREATSISKQDPQGGIGIRLQEHDVDIDDVIFTKHGDARGSPYAAKQKDTRQTSPE